VWKAINDILGSRVNNIDFTAFAFSVFLHQTFDLLVSTLKKLQNSDRLSITKGYVIILKECSIF